MEKRIIAAYDFDGTITKCDTFIDFVIFSKGYARSICYFVFYLPLIISVKVHLYPNWKAKQKIFSRLFRGVKLTDFNVLCERYFESRKDNVIRPRAMRSIAGHIQHNDTIAIVSASVENWVRPFAKELGIQHVLSTEIEVDTDGYLTGRFTTRNCYGSEKVTRILQLFPARESYYLMAYGDSRGDRELLSFADESFYKKFEI